MNRCIIVLGMHRSGTSMVAHILNELGVNMGTRFRIPDEHNTDGYFEDLDWRDLNKKILFAAGGTWYNPPAIVDIERVAPYFQTEIKELTARKSEGGLWGFKDPRTCLTISAIHQYLPKPLYINVTRNATDIIKSLTTRAAKRGYIESTAHWNALLETYRERRLLFTFSQSERHTIRYEKVLETPATEIAGLANRIKIFDFHAIQEAVKIVRVKDTEEKDGLL